MDTNKVADINNKITIIDSYREIVLVRVNDQYFKDSTE